MTKKVTEDKSQKCYNSFSCFLSVMIIITVVVSILWTQFVTMPNFENKLDNMRIEIQDINSKLDYQILHKDSVSSYFLQVDTATHKTVEKQKINNKNFYNKVTY